LNVLHFVLSFYKNAFVNFLMFSPFFSSEGVEQRALTNQALWEWWIVWVWTIQRVSDGLNPSCRFSLRADDWRSSE